jgi:hypothetical protein
MRVDPTTHHQKDWIINEERIFPISEARLRDACRQAKNRAGLADQDPSKARHILNPHSMRKFIRNTLAKDESVDTRDFVDSFISHESAMDRYQKRLLDEQV